MQGPLNVKITV